MRTFSRRGQRAEQGDCTGQWRRELEKGEVQESVTEAVISLCWKPVHFIITKKLRFIFWHFGQKNQRWSWHQRIWITFLPYSLKGMSWNFFFNDYKNIPQALNAVPSREYSRPMKLTKLRSKELKWFPKAQIFHLMEELRRELILPVQCFSMTRCCYVLDENHFLGS